MTNCELCTREIENDEVEHCDNCGADGLCSNCLAMHDCPPS